MPISFRSFIPRRRTAFRQQVITDGNTKTLFNNENQGTYTLYFKDKICPSYAAPFCVLGKGAINNRLSELFMSRLGEMGIETHFIRRLNMSEQLVRAAEPLSVRLTVYNMAVDHLVDRLGLEDRHPFIRPLMEFSHRSRELNYPIISPYHIEAFNWASPDEIDDMISIAYRVNDFLNGHFFAMGFRLLSFHLEFGRIYSGEMMEETRIILIDEISPDTCSILDLASGERFDGRSQETVTKADLTERYQEVARRFGLLEEGGPLDLRESLVLEEDDFQKENLEKSEQDSDSSVHKENN